MATHKQTFTGDSSQLERAYQELAQEVVRLEQSLQKLAATSERTSNKAKEVWDKHDHGIDDAIGQVALLSAQYLGFTTILEGVNQELEHMRELQRATANTQIDVAGSQAQVIKNLTGVDSAERKSFLERVADVAEETQFQDVNQLNQAAASGLSASAGDQEATLDAIRRAALLAKDSPEDLRTFVGAALDLRKATGDDDARKNLGFLLSAGGQSRVVDLRKTAENLAPAVAAGVATVEGDRTQAAIEQAALFAALSNQAVDVQGDSTKTAQTALNVQLQEFFTKAREVSVGGRKMQLAAPDDPGTLLGRIEALQADETLRKQFLKGASFERQFQIPIVQLLGRGRATDVEFREGLKKIKFDTSEYDRTAADLGGLTSEINLAEARRAADANVQQTQLADEEGGRSAVIRDILAKSLADTSQYAESPYGTRYLASQLALWSQDANQALGIDPIESAVDMLRERQEQIRAEDRTLIFRTREGGLTDVPNLPEERRRDYDLLERQIAVLEKLAASSERTATASEEAARKATTPTTSPAAQLEIGRHRER